MNNETIYQDEYLSNYTKRIYNHHEILACYYQGKIDEFIKDVSDYDLIIITEQNIDINKFVSKCDNLDISFYPINLWKDGMYIKPIFKEYINPIFEKEKCCYNLWNDDGSKFVYLSHIIDYSYLSFLSWLNMCVIKLYFNRKNFTCKDYDELLKRMYGLKYLVYMHNTVVNDRFVLEPYSQLFSEIRQMRTLSKFYDRNSDNVLKSYIEQCYVLLSEIINELLCFIYEHKLISVIGNEKDCFFINGRNFVLYIDRTKFLSVIEKHGLLTCMLELYKRNNENILLLPVEFLSNIAEYSKPKGIISDKLSCDIYSDVSFLISENYKDVLSKKSNVLNDWAYYIKKNRISVGFRPFEYRFGTNMKDYMFESFFRYKKFLQMKKIERIKSNIYELY